MKLTTDQKELLFRSSYLTRTFQRLLAAQERAMRNAARKLIKENNADTVYHEPSFLAYQDAQNFSGYASAYYKQLEKLDKTKDMLIDALADFDYTDLSAENVDDLINAMAQETYSPVAGMTFNIFELIIDQAFQEWKLVPQEEVEPTP